jgi:hypothetical protein
VLQHVVHRNNSLWVDMSFHSETLYLPTDCCVSCCLLFKNPNVFIPHISVVFHVQLLNILGFAHIPEKILNKYFEIKGVLNLKNDIAFNIKRLIFGDTIQFSLSFSYWIEKLKNLTKVPPPKKKHTTCNKVQNSFNFKNKYFLVNEYLFNFCAL